MNLKSFALLFVIILGVNVYGQNSPNDCFYKHFSGTLDTNMRLTMDLFSYNGKLSGYYFYSFELSEEPGVYHYGKTIPLTGTLDGNRLIIYEFNNTDSKFTGNVDDDFNIKGRWQRRKYEDPIGFTLKEDYKIGSIPLNCYSKTYERKANLPDDVPENSRPTATFDALVLYPAKEKQEQLNTSIDIAISSFLLNDSLSIKDPELLIENIAFDFFDSYNNATDGVPNMDQSSAFNWQKKLFMETRYNENNLLSLRVNKFGYTGGAHGANITLYRVFNLLNSRPLELEDIFIKGYKEELLAILDKKLRRLNGIQPDERLIESGFLVDSINLTRNFFVNNDGIGFFYNVYEIASYATGSTELFCSFYDLKGILRQGHPFFWIAE